MYLSMGWTASPDYPPPPNVWILSFWPGQVEMHGDHRDIVEMWSSHHTPILRPFHCQHFVEAVLTSCLEPAVKHEMGTSRNRFASLLDPKQNAQRTRLRGPWRISATKKTIATSFSK